MKEAFKKEKSKSDFSEFREKKFQVDSKRENIIRSSMSKENIIKEKFWEYEFIVYCLLFIVYCLRVSGSK